MTGAVSTGSRIRTAALVAVLVAAILCGLIYGSGLLIPIAIAGLFTGILTTAIIRLEKAGLPKWLATIVSISLGIVVLVLIGLVFQSQAGALEEAWPLYVQRFQTLDAQLTFLVGPNIAAQVTAAVSNLDLGGMIASVASSAGSVFGDIALILIYTGFLLAERGMLRTKLDILVPGETDNRELNEVITSIGHSIRRYLSIKSSVSALTGLLTFAVLKFYGVNFAELLGLLAFLLNFIPVIGSAVAVAIPVVLALMQFDTLAPALQVAVLLAAVQAGVGNVIEPRMMGRTLNLSPFVVMVSLTFWTMIWGIAGAFLSVPITVSTVIVCRNIQPLRWIAVLLSADGNPEPADEPEQPTILQKWPFTRPAAPSEEVESLRAELETLKAERQSSKKAKKDPPAE